MTHSLNEIEAVAKRAARGAGFDWGMAEEAAKAARWLASHDLAGPDLLADVLSQNENRAYADIAPASLDGTWHASSGVLCPLASGAALNDCADRLARGDVIVMADVSCPLLILPFAAWAASHIEQPVSLTWTTVTIETDGEGVWIVDPDHQINLREATAVTCQQTSKCEEAPQRPGLRGQVAPDIWARLNEFAERTYAPATEASRLLGAGAGVSDND